MEPRRRPRLPSDRHEVTCPTCEGKGQVEVIHQYAPLKGIDLSKTNKRSGDKDLNDAIWSKSGEVEREVKKLQDCVRCGGFGTVVERNKDQDG